MQQKIVYIASQGHSGSTLLDLLIASHSKFESAGEVSPSTMRTLFSGSGPDRCACGSAVEACDRWKRVVQRLITAGIADAEQLLASPENAGVFVEAVLSASGRAAYVESSKTVGRLKTLLACPKLDVHVIHLIRDPRANAYSWRRKKKGRLHAWMGKWLRLNRRIERLDIRQDRLMRVLYEDLATNPDAVVAAVMAFCGERFEPEQMRFRRKQHHTISGNRMRINGDDRISPDTRYIDALGNLEWWASVALAFRGLRKYGYPLSKQAMRARLQPDAGPAQTGISSTIPS